MKVSTKVALTALGLIVIAILLWKIPQLQSEAYRAKFTFENIQELEQKDRITLEKSASDVENGARVTLAQIFGGLALLSGLYFSYQNVRAAQDNIKLTQENLRITEEGKLTDRFSKAVELLGSEKLDIRLGGIYALDRISRDSQKDHWTVMEVLTAFVRENAPVDPGETEVSENPPRPREDIQAIMTVIGRRKWTETETSKRLDLSDVNLAGYALDFVNLGNANLRGANLSKTYLSSANLGEANLSGADLSGANLSGANLMGVDLSLADLGEAILMGTDLSQAYLAEADLMKANLMYANLTESFLSEANLSKASLIGAKLVDSNLIGADLSEATLIGAFLFGANLSNANLRGANLGGADFGSENREDITLAQILEAYSLENIKLPPELEKELNEWRANRDKEKAGAGKKQAGD